MSAGCPLHKGVESLALCKGRIRSDCVAGAAGHCEAVAVPCRRTRAESKIAAAPASIINIVAVMARSVRPDDAPGGRLVPGRSIGPLSVCRIPERPCDRIRAECGGGSRTALGLVGAVEVGAEPTPTLFVLLVNGSPSYFVYGFEIEIITN